MHWFSLLLSAIFLAYHVDSTALRPRRAACAEIVFKNFTNEDYTQGLDEIKSEFEVHIVEALRESSTLVGELSSIGAAQESSLIAENLCQIAALTPDVSLVSDMMPIQRFHYLTTPKSFKASLVQMVHSMCDSFSKADNSMNRIKLALVSLPTLLGGTIQLLTSTETEGRGFILELNMDRIKDAAEVAASEAEAVAKQFEGTMEMIKELIIASITCESNSKLQKQKKEAMRNAFEKEAEAEKVYNQQIAKDEQEMRQRVRSTLAKYDKQVKKMGNFGFVFLTALSQAVVDLVGNFNPFKIGKFGNMGGGGSAGSTADQISEARMFSSGVNFFGGLYNGLSDNVTDSDKPKFLTVIDEALNTDFAKSVKDVAATFQKLRTSISEASETDAQSQEAYKATKAEVGQEIQKAAEAANKASGGGQGGSPSRGGGSGRIADTLARGVEELRGQYELQSRMAEELREKMRESSLRINAITSKLETINLETAQLAEIIEYLNLGLKYLNEAKEVWILIQRFFQRFRDMAAEVLVKNIQEFEKIADKLKEKRIKLIEERMLQTATKLTAECVAMYYCAETYAEVSKRNIMPLIAGVGKNLQLSKGEAKSRLANSRNRMDTEMCQVNHYLGNRMNEIMSLTKKHAIDFMKSYVKNGFNSTPLLN